MTNSRIKKIIEIDTTPEQAISTYGDFVNFLNATAKRIKKSKLQGWTRDRLNYSKAIKKLPDMQEAIIKKFGQDVMFQAIQKHIFL